MSKIMPTEVTAVPPIYVSYLPVSAGQRRFLRVYVVAVLWGLALLAFFWARTQQSPGAAVWEDGKLRIFSGTYLARPYPMLYADDVGTGKPGIMLLVEVGKHGVTRIASELDGTRITLSGWLLRRDGRTMIELDPVAAMVPAGGTLVGGGADLAASGAMQTPAAAGKPRWNSADDSAGGLSRDLLRSGPGEVRVLRGEIVDFKCFLGAMKPGDGKSHKACAGLCVRGGVPPVLVTTDGSGQRGFYLLQSPEGGPIDSELYRFVGDDVEISGPVTKIGDLSVVSVTNNSVHRQ